MILIQSTVILIQSTVIYNIDVDINKLNKQKITNRDFKKFEYYDKFKEHLIKNNKFIFDIITIDTLIEKHYNCHNLIRI